MVRVTKDLTSKTTIIDNDQFAISDSADLNDLWDTESGRLKRLSWVNLKTSISSYYNALTATITNKTIDLSSNTFTTTKAQLNTAVSNGDVVYTNDTSVLSNSWVLDEDDMVSDSNTKVPTQQSTKAYVQANIGFNITWLTEEPAIASWDFVPFYDTTAWVNRKIDYGDLFSLSNIQNILNRWANSVYDVFWTNSWWYDSASWVSIWASSTQRTVDVNSNACSIYNYFLRKDTGSVLRYQDLSKIEAVWYGKIDNAWGSDNKFIIWFWDWWTWAFISESSLNQRAVLHVWNTEDYELVSSDWTLISTSSSYAWNLDSKEYRLELIPWVSFKLFVDGVEEISKTSNIPWAISNSINFWAGAENSSWGNFLRYNELKVFVTYN